MQSYDAIIAGGGIIGVSLALELRQRGLSVLVLDRGQPGAEASTAGAGMLVASEMEGPPELRELARLSAEMFPHFVQQAEDASGVRVDFHRAGAIRLSAASLPSDPAPLTDAELAALEPALAGTSLRAHFVEENAVDPRTLMPALVESLKQAGGHIHAGSEVVAVGEQFGGVTGVRTPQTSFAASIVVNCCGAWAANVAPQVPARPVKGHMLALIPAKTPLLRHVVRLRDADLYLVPRRDGRIAVGSTVEEAGFDKHVDPDTIQRLHQRAADLVPDLGEAKMHEAWTGLRPGSPDKLPIMGATATRGLFVATGHFRNGILLAPATAMVMADLITGSVPRIALAPFVPERFPAR